MSDNANEEMSILYGQAWISGDSLLQNQTMMLNGASSDATICLIKNIWNNLLNQEEKGEQSRLHCQQGKSKGYFYWEYDQTDTASQLANGSYSVAKIRFECPKPKPELLDSFFTRDVEVKRKVKDETGKEKEVTETVTYKIDPKDWDVDPETSPLRDSEWALYWAGQIKTANINYDKAGSLQKKEVTFNTREIFRYNGDGKDENGNEIALEDTVIKSTTITEKNTEFGNVPGSMVGDNLITDLLNMF